MALKLTVDKVDDLDENLRPLYVEKDGKFHLAVDGLDDTGALKGALSKERKRADDNEKAKKRWETLGKTPEEIQELLAAQEQREQTEAERKGEWEKLKAQMNSAHADALKVKDDQVGKMRTTLERHLIDAQATSAIAAAKGVPDLLLPHVQKHVRVVEENGEYIAKVVDAKGDPRVNGNGEPLSIPDLIAEMKATEIYGRAFDGSGQSGGGTPPGNGGGGSSQPVKRRSDLKTREQRTAFVTEHGSEAYAKLPA